MRARLTLCDGWRGVHAHVRHALSRQASCGPLALRDILILVPTTTARHLLQTGLEQSLLQNSTVSALPTISTMNLLLRDLAQRTLGKVGLVDPLLREALLEKSLHEAAETGARPPFEIRSSLAPRILALYDRIYLQGYRFDEFTSRALEEFNAPGDVGAERMAAQTRFLLESLRRYGQELTALDFEDEITLRRALIEHSTEFPHRRVLVIGAETLEPADLSFLCSTKGLDSLELVIPESMSETCVVRRFARTTSLEKAEVSTPLPTPSLLCPSSRWSSDSPNCWSARDREDVLTDVARLIKAMAAEERLPPLERIAIAVPSRLPYLYLAKKVLEQAGVPFQLEDDFPLAAEPFIAAMDLVLELVGDDAHRAAAVGLLQNPFFRFPGVDSAGVAALDRELVKRRESGGTKTWRRMLEKWKRRPVQKALPGIEDREQASPGMPALEALVRCGEQLAPLAVPTSTCAEKAEAFREFLARFGRPLQSIDDRERHERARGAFLSILERLSDAARRVGDRPFTFQEFREKLHRAIESHTFSLRAGGHAVHIVDSRSVGFGTFDIVFAVGLNEGEWPARAERNIFYPQWLLKDFGWPTDTETLALQRAYFIDLLRLPERAVGVFRHLLEDEIPTVPSPFLEEVVRVTGRHREDAPEKMETIVISRAEALRNEAIPIDKRFRRERSRGLVNQPVFDPEPISATAFELYLRCPFKFFSRYVLGIEEEEDLDDGFTPVERGRILHAVLQTAFDRWDAHETGPRPITPENYDDALSLFKKVALEKLPMERRAIEMVRLFGGPGEPGAIEWLLRLEMKRGPLRRRLLEYAFASTFRLDTGPNGETPWKVQVKGRADRLDIDSRGYLHLFDYKSGRAPESKLTIQVPLYALCLSQELSTKTAEAVYLSLRDKKIVPRQDYPQALQRLRETFKNVSEGRFTPQPYQDHLCHTCGYVGVCRKEIQETGTKENIEAT